MGISLTMVMSCDVIGYSEATIWSSSLGRREHQKRVVPVFFLFRQIQGCVCVSGNGRRPHNCNVKGTSITMTISDQS